MTPTTTAQNFFDFPCPAFVSSDSQGETDLPLLPPNLFDEFNFSTPSSPSSPLSGREDARVQDIVAEVTAPVPTSEKTSSSSTSALAARRVVRVPHACTKPGCGKAFAKMQHLIAHLSTHSSEQPFECREPTCGAAYGSSGSLRRHEKKHTTQKDYHCGECPFESNRPDIVVTHLRNRHHDLMENKNGEAYVVTRVGQVRIYKPN